MLLKKISSCLLIIGLLTSCNTPKEEARTSFESIEEAFEILSKSKNYTLETDYYDNDQRADNKIYFTKEAYFVEEPIYQYGYIEDKAGVYYLDLYRNKLVPSKILKDDNNEVYKNLWTSGLFNSFSGFDLDTLKINENGKYYISDKLMILKYMDILNIQAANYSLVKNMTIDYIDNESLSINLNYRDGNVTKTIIKDINKTKIDEVETFLDNGGKPFIQLEEYDRIIDLFSGFNYKRACLDVDNETVIGYEWYNPNYFYGAWEDDYYLEHVGEIYEIGVIGIKNKVLNGRPLNGSYYFTYQGVDIQVITTQPINTDPDVTKVYNYPTYLLALDNFQYFEVNTEYENTISTTNYDLIIDFCKNFQIYDTLAENNCLVVELEISYELVQENSDCNVCFTLYYEYNGQLGAFVYPFVDFGEANILIADVYLSELEDGEINE